MYKPTATRVPTPRERTVLGVRLTGLDGTERSSSVSGGRFELAPERRFEVVEFAVEVALEERLYTR